MRSSHPPRPTRAVHWLARHRRGSLGGAGKPKGKPAAQGKAGQKKTGKRGEVKKSGKKKDEGWSPLAQAGLGAFALGIVGMLLPLVGLELVKLRKVGPIGGGVFAIFGAIMLLVGFYQQKKLKEGLLFAGPMAVLGILGMVAWSVIPGILESMETAAEAGEQSGQQEYLAGYALTFGLVLLGVLVTCIPRPRALDLPENLKKQERERSRRALTAKRR